MAHHGCRPQTTILFFFLILNKPIAGKITGSPFVLGQDYKPKKCKKKNSSMSDKKGQSRLIGSGKICVH